MSKSTLTEEGRAKYGKVVVEGSEMVVEREVRRGILGRQGSGHRLVCLGEGRSLVCVS